MKKVTSNSLVVSVILAILIVIFLTSCGSRKVSKSNVTLTDSQSVEKTSIDSSKTSKNTSSNVQITENKELNEFVLEPIDTSKEFIYNDKKYKNVRLTHRNIKSNTNIDKVVKVSEIKQNNVKTSSKEIKEKKVNVITKDIHREQSYWWLLWLLLLIPAYFLWQKFKDKIWFI